MTNHWSTNRFLEKELSPTCMPSYPTQLRWNEKLRKSTEDFSEQVQCGHLLIENQTQNHGEYRGNPHIVNLDIYSKESKELSASGTRPTSGHLFSMLTLNSETNCTLLKVVHCDKSECCE